jgi:hypothetical protein
VRKPESIMMESYFNALSLEELNYLEGFFNDEDFASSTDDSQSFEPTTPSGYCGTKRRLPFKPPCKRSRFIGNLISVGSNIARVPRSIIEDQRYSYGKDFVEAFNSCNVNDIWSFLNRRSAPDFKLLHTWVGPQAYFNFPVRLLIEGISAAAEYWLARCLLSPDLCLSLMHTKVIERKNGDSSVMFTYISKHTRLYDGEFSDKLICQPPSSQTDQLITQVLSPSADSSSPSFRLPEGLSESDLVFVRASRKVQAILKKMAPALPAAQYPSPKLSCCANDSNLGQWTALCNSADRGRVIINSSDNRQLLPCCVSLQFLGAVTMHLDYAKKIKSLELAYSLAGSQK